jgi:hypothetical protein
MKARPLPVLRLSSTFQIMRNQSEKSNAASETRNLGLTIKAGLPLFGPLRTMFRLNSNDLQSPHSIQVPMGNMLICWIGISMPYWSISLRDIQGYRRRQLAASCRMRSISITLDEENGEPPDAADASLGR